METFDFNAKLKRNLFMMMGAGVVGILFLLLYPQNHFSRLWANILANTYYFTGIALFGMFVVAATQLAYGGWQTLLKRIFLSMSAFVGVGGLILAAIVGLGLLGVHSLYDHVKEILHTDPVPPIYTTKVIWFAPVFWLIRLVGYAALWYFFSRTMNNFFARTDQTDPAVYKRSKLLAAAFIVVFAVTESAVSWDMIMSLDPHWYSTLFGWYNFASYGCAAWGMSILLVIYLKSKGYIERVNENHVHDLGKMLFGFSVFWTYLWFSQFMLQWFANMPEETNFWVKRFDTGYFKATIFLSLLINFFFPLIFLIKRGAKRSFKMIGFGAALLIFGHYVDFFNYTFVEPNWNPEVMEHHGAGHDEASGHKEHSSVNEKEVVLYAQADAHGGDHGTSTSGNQETPPNDVHNTTVETKQQHPHGGAEGGAHGGKHHDAPVKNFGGIGIGELLVFIGFLGAFLFMFFNNLAKRPIIPENDPYLKESEKLTVTYA